MKRFSVLFLVLIALVSYGQSKDEKALIERTYLLSHTVFGTKDSAVLEELFAKKATYGHSGGNIQNRAEAIGGISRNRSVYSDTSVSDMNVLIGDDVAIVRHLFRATETGIDGKVTPLKFSMMLVWVEERGKWRLMGRQAVKIQ